MFVRILQCHHKTVITFVGFFLSVLGWFVWNLFISAAHPISFGPYIVRGSFVHEFGNKLGWWTIAGATTAAVLAFELGLTALQRIYFPRDEHLWQEIEREGGVSEVLKEHAAEEGRAVSIDAGAEQQVDGGDDSEQSHPLTPVMSQESSGGNGPNNIFIPPISMKRSRRQKAGAGAHGPVVPKSKRIQTV